MSCGRTVADVAVEESTRYIFEGVWWIALDLLLSRLTGKWTSRRLRSLAHRSRVGLSEREKFAELGWREEGSAMLVAESNDVLVRRKSIGSICREFHGVADMLVTLSGDGVQLRFFLGEFSKKFDVFFVSKETKRLVLLEVLELLQFCARFWSQVFQDFIPLIDMDVFLQIL